MSEATLRTTTGIPPRPPAITFGLASLGRVDFTESTALFRSSETLAEVLPYSNSTRTVEIPLWLVEEVVVTPSRFATEFSITRLICESTTSGDAPG